MHKCECKVKTKKLSCDINAYIKKKMKILFWIVYKFRIFQLKFCKKIIAKRRDMHMKKQILRPFSLSLSLSLPLSSLFQWDKQKNLHNKMMESSRWRWIMWCSSFSFNIIYYGQWWPCQTTFHFSNAYFQWGHGNLNGQSKF